MVLLRTPDNLLISLYNKKGRNFIRPFLLYSFVHQCIGASVNSPEPEITFASSGFSFFSRVITL